MKRKSTRAHKCHFTAYVAASIDGRISLKTRERPNWTSPEDWEFLQEQLRKADAVVVGKNTYIAAKKRLDKRTTFVLSSKVKTLVQKGTVTFVNPAHTDLKKLFSPYRTVAIVGGSRVYQTMLDKKLLDELFVTIEPLVFGRGKAMFEGGSKTKQFTLTSVKKINNGGTLLLHYKTK